MTPDQFKRIEDFFIFSKAAATRCGTPFLCETFALEKGRADDITVKGKVFVKGTSSVEVPVAMEWNLEGTALQIGSHFDLITEASFTDTDA